MDGSVDLALPALRDPDWGMRTIVASEIGPTGDQRIVDALVALLNDEDGYVREAAAIGLETQGDTRALDPLRAMVRRERKDTVAKARAERRSACCRSEPEARRSSCGLPRRNRNLWAASGQIVGRALGMAPFASRSWHGRTAPQSLRLYTEPRPESADLSGEPRARGA